MPLTIVTGGPGQGKTQALIERAVARYGRDPFAPSLVLVPTSRHADQFRRRLVARVGTAFGLEVATLSGWSRDVAAAAGRHTPVRDLAEAVLGDAIRAAAAAGRAPAFAPVAEAPGLLPPAGEAIAELVAEGIAPDAFTAAAEAGAVSPNVVSLAAVYEAFLAALAGAGLVHSSATAAEAARAIERGAATVPPFVLVDGFQYLRAGEIAAIAALAAGAEVTLAFDPEAGERARFSFDRLVAAAPAAIERTTRASPVPHRAAISARDRDGELRAIARDIKDRLTADPSLRPSDFAVAFRQVTPLLPLARQVFGEYDLPLDPAAGFAPGALPFGTWARRFLSLGRDGWQQRDLLAVLRSGFVGRRRWEFNRAHVAAIAYHARRHKLWSGMEALREIADGLQREGMTDSQREAGERLGRLLDDLGDLLDPARTAPVAVFAAAIDEAMFGRDAIVRAGTDAAAQIEAFRGILAGAAEAGRVRGAAPVTFAAFVSAVVQRMERPSLLVREAGGVVLAPVHTLHGLRFRYVALGGLREGEFPAPRRIPGMLEGDTRRALIAAGLPLPPRARASEDELFAAANSRADSDIVFARPRLDADGRKRASSHYFPPDIDVTEERADLQSERAASMAELAFAAVRAWPTKAERPEGYEPWETIRLAAEIEARRRSYAEAGIYEGRLTTADGAALADREQKWSASRFESYNTCGFQFFASYGLHLHELDRELQSADAAALGTAVHDILEHATRPLVEARLPLTEETLPLVHERLDTDGKAAWDEAPREYGFGRAGLWRLRWPRVRERMARMLVEEAAANATFGVTEVAGAELVLDTRLPLAGGAVRFGGKIDRVDLGPGVAVVVDYKSGKAIAKADVENAEKLQLQLYAAALREQIPGLDRVVARYAYLRPIGERHRAVVDTFSPERIDTALERAEAILTRAAEGRFGPVQGPFLEDVDKRPCPTYCPFKHICRVTPVSKWKQWN